MRARHRGGAARRAATALAALPLASALLLAGCRGGDATAPPPEPPPDAEPAGAPADPTPVEVTHRVEAHSVSAADVLDKRGGITPPRTRIDEPALAGVADELVELLRAHLDDLNLGGAGELHELGAAVWALDPSLAERSGRALASPSNPARAADVLVRVAVDGTPRWAQVELDVLRQDGSRVALELVFATEGALELLVLGTDDGGAS